MLPDTSFNIDLPLDAGHLVAMFLAGRSARTAAAYRDDLGRLAVFMGAAHIDDAVRTLLAATSGTANRLALGYRTHMSEGGLAPATINRRLSSLRALVALARTLGLVAWRVEIANMRARHYRDTRGPGDAGVRALIAVAAAQTDRTKAARDVALLRLLHDLGLRRGEAAALDLSDLDRAAGRLSVRGKGYVEKTTMTLPAAMRAAIEAWLAVRSAVLSAGHSSVDANAPSPLFLSLDISGKGGRDRRLTGAGIWSIVHELGRTAGLAAWPHGLRHSAITRALDTTGGHLRRVMRFSRHRDVRTLMTYDDNRQDFAGQVAGLVAEVTA